MIKSITNFLIILLIFQQLKSQISQIDQNVVNPFCDETLHNVLVDSFFPYLPVVLFIKLAIFLKWLRKFWFEKSSDWPIISVICRTVFNSQISQTQLVENVRPNSTLSHPLTVRSMQSFKRDNDYRNKRINQFLVNPCLGICNLIYDIWNWVMIWSMACNWIVV